LLNPSLNSYIDHHNSMSRIVTLTDVARSEQPQSSPIRYVNEIKEIDENSIPTVLREDTDDSKGSGNWMSNFIAGFKSMIDVKKNKAIYSKIVNDNCLTEEEKKEILDVLQEMELLYPELADFIRQLQPKVLVLKDFLDEDDEIRGDDIIKVSNEINITERKEEARTLGKKVTKMIMRVTKILDALKLRLPEIDQVNQHITKSWWDYISTGLIGLGAGVAIAVTGGAAIPVVIGLATVGAAAGLGAVKLMDKKSNPEYIRITTLIADFNRAIDKLQQLEDHLKVIERNLSETGLNMEAIVGKSKLFKVIVKDKVLVNFRVVVTKLLIAIDEMAVILNLMRKPR
jgi:hypothetical protein